MNKTHIEMSTRKNTKCEPVLRNNVGVENTLRAKVAPQQRFAFNKRKRDDYEEEHEDDDAIMADTEEEEQPLYSFVVKRNKLSVPKYGYLK